MLLDVCEYSNETERRNAAERTKMFSKNFKNNTRKFLRGDFCIQKNLFELFQTPGHTVFIEGVCITFIDKSLLFTDLFIPEHGDY